MSIDKSEDLTGVERRDYLARHDVMLAIKISAGPDFSNREALEERTNYLKAFPRNKWLWGVIIVGSLLYFLDFAIGAWVIGWSALVFVWTAVESFFVEQKHEAGHQRLREFCYRWMAIGLPEEVFWEYGRLAERESKSWENEADRKKYEQAEARWWRHVEAELIAKAKLEPWSTWPMDEPTENGAP